jgi:hypothetical protein
MAQQHHPLLSETLPGDLPPGLIAGIGRVIQLKGFGEISATTNIIMEIVVESARLMLFIYIVGSASLKMGVSRLAGLFKRNNNSKAVIKLAVANFKRN